MCRLSKYNPKYRNPNDNYTRDEWISFSDVGEVFNGEIFSKQSYLLMEDNYISSIKNFFKSKDVGFVSCLEVEDYFEQESLKGEELDLYEKFKILPSDRIDLEQIGIVAKLILRDIIWCKFRSQSKVEVCVGHDFYMYFHSPDQNYEFVTPKGIYVEPRICSPYTVAEEGD